ncbi:MAG TPA: alpha/beta fold hydrolase [Rudaea sp.]
MTSNITRTLSAALLACAALASMPVACAATAQAPAKIVLTDCRIEGFEGKTRCGTLDVAENPARPAGRRLSLRVVVVPAQSAKPLPDPIFELYGGPGESAASAVADAAPQMVELNRDRDLVYFEQRGTGPHGLNCDLYDRSNPAVNLRELFPHDFLVACGHRLAAAADLSQYSYAHFADDIETVRRALGYGPLNLFAGSYGTRAAQVYARMYPKSVRTIYMGSIVPIDIATPAPFARAVQAPLDRTIADCAADKDCHAAYPQLREEFDRLLADFDAGKAQVPVPGTDRRVAMPRGRFVEFLRSMVYKPEGAADVPWTIHHAATGDWNPIVEKMLQRLRDSATDISWGLFFTITCSEDVAFLDEAQIHAQTDGTYLGDHRVRSQQAVCADWSKYPLPAHYRDPVRTSVPTLFVSGELDPATPLWFTEHAAPGFSERHEIVLYGQGHMGWNDCVARTFVQFVRDGSVRNLKETCAERAARPAFKL